MSPAFLRGHEAEAAAVHVRLAREVHEYTRDLTLAEIERASRDSWATAAACLLVWLLGNGGER